MHMLGWKKEGLRLSGYLVRNVVSGPMFARLSYFAAASGDPYLAPNAMVVGPPRAGNVFVPKSGPHASSTGKWGWHAGRKHPAPLLAPRGRCLVVVTSMWITMDTQSIRGGVSGGPRFFELWNFRPLVSPRSTFQTSRILAPLKTLMLVLPRRPSSAKALQEGNGFTRRPELILMQLMNPCTPFSKWSKGMLRLCPFSAIGGIGKVASPKLGSSERRLPKKTPSPKFL